VAAVTRPITGCSSVLTDGKQQQRGRLSALSLYCTGLSWLCNGQL
jgi:hypothetical protein